MILKEEEQHLLDNLLTAYNQSEKGISLNKLRQLAYFFNRLNKRTKEDLAESSDQAIIRELQLSLPSELQDKLKQEAVRLLKEKFQEHLQTYFLNRKSDTEVWKLNDCYGIIFKSPISVFTEEMKSLMDHGLLQYVHGSIHMNMDKGPKILTDFIKACFRKEHHEEYSNSYQ